MSTSEQSTKVITGIIRLSYASLFKARAAQDGNDPKFSTSILIPKSDTATIEKLKAAIESAKEIGKTSKWNGKIPAKLTLPLRDGDVERPEDPAYAGHYFINASSKQKPGIIDLNKKEITDETEVYSGCFCRVSLNLFPYDSKGNKGVGVGLNNVQKIKDGEALGGRARAEDDFNDDFAESVIAGEEDDDLI